MNNYTCIDLDTIKNIIINFASIRESKEYILNEKVVFNPLLIKRLSLQTKEAMNLIKNDIYVSFSSIQNIDELLVKANKSITLNGIELKDILVFHNHCNRIKNIFDSIDAELSLKDYSDSIVIRNDVFDYIDKCIDNAGEIKDDASDRLKQINNSINIVEKRLYDKAQHFIDSHISSLQENSIYFRDGRLSFLIKNSDKNKYNGYSYGSSSSGLATYVEPEIFIELNNELVNLKHDKDDEIERILRHLTDLVSNVSDEYKNNFESLLNLDVVFAKATYGINNKGIIPEYVEGNYFDFKDLCHPLLDPKKVVSNSYRIYSPYQGIVISGSNTGGKTVSLKAIGLSIVMSYIGIPIIASSASIPFYKNIYVDIDDNQSIQDSLSTFSAHISNINYIVSNADKNSLILIDELISGTDPKQAQAISLAILDKIKQIGSIFVITTHYDDIKKYSYDDENILLSAVGFDSDSLKPTYKYIENSIGVSNALSIASRYFDDKSIITNAQNYLKQNQTAQDELIDKLSKQIEHNDKERIKINELENRYNKLIEDINIQKRDFELEKTNLKNKYLDELNEYIDSIKNKAQNIIDSIKENSKNNDIIKNIESLIEDDNDVQDEINVGDNVRIKNNEQIGVVTSLKEDKATINLNGLTIKANVSDLTIMPKITKKEKYVEKKRYQNVSKELNIVGEHIEEGIALLEEYLDKANACNLSSVKIIHGVGSGALRTAVRNKISKLSYVDKFYDGDFYDGGSAVTIVEFKK